ncbi:MAG: DMT family protein, partial [Betaproteobacteria bacterium]
MTFNVIPVSQSPFSFFGLLIVSNIFMTFAWYAHLR